MPLSPTFLVFRTGFAHTNGTSVQMARLFGDSGESLIHVPWDKKEGGPDSVRWVVHTDDGFRWKRPFGRVGQVLLRLRGLVWPNWWQRGKVNAAKLARALARTPLRPRQAYVTFFKEAEAAKACAIWEALGCPPFVLHMLDITDTDFSETNTPHSLQLIRNASHVFCLNRLIEGEMQRVGAVATSLFPLCSDLEPTPRSVPTGPLKIIISGALYADVKVENEAMTLLLEAWPALEKVFPGAELHYSGAASWGLPTNLQSRLHDHGLLSTEDYQRLLRSCHVAYVPVSHLQQSFLRFSLPSRIPDYLISGLPVIACTDEGTGIHEFFQSAPPECTRLVRTPGDLVSTVQEFAGDAQRWKTASDAAIAFSKDTFAVEPARKKMFNQLEMAGRGIALHPQA